MALVTQTDYYNPVWVVQRCFTQGGRQHIGSLIFINLAAHKAFKILKSGDNVSYISSIHMAWIELEYSQH